MNARNERWRKQKQRKQKPIKSGQHAYNWTPPDSVPDSEPIDAWWMAPEKEIETDS